MKLKEIELYNIRSHESSTLRFDNGITVLSGRTGSGKSSFLIGIEYALFGADTNLNTSALLRRNSGEGYVKLTLEDCGRDYEIMRGLIKKGKSVLVNPDKLWIKEAGSKMPLIARTAEFNERVLQLLKYPVDIKPKELFEVTSYAKQDEIRKLIELTAENRQRYIDRILQLSKYQLTWGNMKELINELRNDLSELKGRTGDIELIERELKDKEQELVKRDSEFKNCESALKTVNEKLNELIVKLRERSKLLESVEAQNKKLELKRSMIENLERDKDGLSGEIKILNNELKNKPVIKLSVEELVSKKSSLEQSIIHKKELINDVNNELIKLSGLKGNCPLCKQAVSASHKKEVESEFKSRLKIFDDELKKIDGELRLVKDSLLKAQADKRLIDDFNVKERLLIEKNKALNSIIDKIKALNDEIKGIKLVDNSSLRSEVELLLSDEKSLLSSQTGLKERGSMISEIISGLKSFINDRRANLLKLKEDKAMVDKLEAQVNLLNRLRGDIRNIREVVRNKFLEDFRQEFQSKYEEIREEDDYTVEIMTDYEPIAYSNGVETPVTNLSGGEKTSVALAYRLALSEIAARLSDVEQSELLILDEPTTGFDRNDIKALPKALRNIKTIPQIIIVSHDDELKEAADHNYEISKTKGVSIIKKILMDNERLRD